MGIKVNINDIIDGMEKQSMETQTYLDKQTGEIEILWDHELRAAEDDDSPEEFPEWERGQLEIARDVLYGDRYIHLPDQFEIHEWDIMRRFCYTINEDRLRAVMLDSIHGSGAFRMFRDSIYRYNLADSWDDFRYAALKEIARDWCRVNKIEFVE